MILDFPWIVKNDLHYPWIIESWLYVKKLLYMGICFDYVCKKYYPQIVDNIIYEQIV